MISATEASVSANPELLAVPPGAVYFLAYSRGPTISSSGMAEFGAVVCALSGADQFDFRFHLDMLFAVAKEFAL